jgi:cytochrome c oxidase subunit III
LRDAHSLYQPLQHQFETLVQQDDAASLGMWVFLVTEILFFGGLFGTYAVYRSAYPRAFAAGSRELHIWLGTINTAVLITSSFTMALSVHAAQTGSRRLVSLFLVLTMALGIAFLGIKGIEYAKEFAERHVPGGSFQFAPEYAREAQIFFSLYFVMTGLHALHMIIGIGVLLTMLWFSSRGRFSAEYCTPLEVAGLYWHFVDIIWIFLLPLLYLVGRHGAS